MTRIIFSVLVSAALVGPVAAAEPVELAPDAPDTYTVTRGDTLWGISGRFLKEPWRWPEVWRLNRDQIRNPHLIYPGQVIVLDRSGPYLGIGRKLGEPPYEKRFPQVYSEPTSQAIPSIPVKDIEPFLTRPLVVDKEDLEGAGTVVATETSRVYTAAGDTIFAKNIDDNVKVWQVFRPAKPLVDPVTEEVLGYEASFLGTARLTEPGQPPEVEHNEIPEDESYDRPIYETTAATDVRVVGLTQPATLRVTDAVEEIGTGDRLIPAGRPEMLSYVPHAPDSEISGRVISIYRGVAETGRHHVVTLGLGKQDGIERGHVLALHRSRGTVEYKDDGSRETYRLPEHRYGLVFVFRVFDRVSYALVTDADGQVTVGDSVRKP